MIKRWTAMKWGAIALGVWATLGTAAIFSGVARAADGTVEIKNAWNEGRYSALQETSVSYVEQNGREVLARAQTRATFSWQVESEALRADGVRVLKLKAERVMIRLQSDGADIAYYDSDNPLRGDELMKDVFAKLMKSEFVVELKDGKVVKVEGCDEFAKTLPVGESESEKYFVEHIKTTVATPGNIAQIFDPIAYPLPRKPVAVGDRWTTETPFALPVIGEKKLVLDCELKTLKRAEPKANVAAEAVLDVDLTAGASATIKIDIDGKYNLTDGVADDFTSRATVNIELPRKDKTGAEIVVKAIGVIRNKLTVVKR
ncbi:MAG: hypothetical protein IJO40_14500 [Thermoguttaceae bacterium]|nr:hypothetical protein [Thermoguttaceae bacterium]